MRDGIIAFLLVFFFYNPRFAVFVTRASWDRSRGDAIYAGISITLNVHHFTRYCIVIVTKTFSILNRKCKRSEC